MSRAGGNLSSPFCKTVTTSETDLFHELLHVLFLLENKCSQVLERDVVLHVLGVVVIFHVDLRNWEKKSPKHETASAQLSATGLR